MSDLSKLYFADDILVFLTLIDAKGKSMPISRTLRNMQDLMDLRKEIKDGKLLPHVGDFTLDQQLWFALAKYAKLIRDRDNVAPLFPDVPADTGTKPQLPPGAEFLDPSW